MVYEEALLTAAPVVYSVSEKAMLNIAETAEALLQFLEEMRQGRREGLLVVAAVRALGRLVIAIDAEIGHTVLVQEKTFSGSQNNLLCWLILWYFKFDRAASKFTPDHA